MIFVTTIDPRRIFNVPWGIKCSSHFNPVLKKYELIEKNNNIDSVILGSSTSENYLPVDFEHIWGKTLFHGSVAGSKTMDRFVLFSKALKHFEGLESLFYVSDFYEFNENIKDYFDLKVSQNEKLKKELNQTLLDLIPLDLEARIWSLFSFEALEKSFTQIKKCMTKNEEYYSDNGVVLKLANSNVANTLIYKDQNNDVISEKLKDDLSQNIVEYKTGALKDFKYSLVTEKMYHLMIEAIKSKNKKMYIIISPYHASFAQSLFKDEKLLASYQRWKNFVRSLDNGVNVFVFDFETSHLRLPLNELFWRDGVHYSQKASAIIMKSIKN